MRNEFDMAKNKVNANMKVLQGQFECCQKELVEARAELNLLKENQNKNIDDKVFKGLRSKGDDSTTILEATH